MSSQTRKTNLTRLLKRVATTLIIAFSALVFPSALPWMVAFWLLCFTVLASRNQPGWAPLLICLCILVVKLVPRTPALLVFIALLTPIFSQPTCSPVSNCICDNTRVNLLKDNNWIVVPWDTGQCYFHNFVTREDRDDVPPGIFNLRIQNEFGPEIVD